MIVLRARECKQIYVSEPTMTRAAQNKQIADQVFDPASANIEEECLRLTGGEGVDVVFDCAGVQRGMEAGMAALRHRGTYMNVAGWETPVSALLTIEQQLLTCSR
jgi:threonine dehydrogenase-like Zn-dependent dehydrogenase